jgi:hypothetical protein
MQNTTACAAKKLINKHLYDRFKSVKFFYFFIFLVSYYADSQQKSM